MYTYKQSTGELLSLPVDALPPARLLAIGYSGTEEGRNNPAMEMAKGIGPIPEGNYTFGIAYDSEHTGPLTLPVTPDAETAQRITEMGRDPNSFRMHGDNIKHDASHGCIIMLRTVREAIDKGVDKALTVIV